MRILIAYGTTEGQTRKIAKALADRAREFGHEVELFDTSDNPRDLHVDAFDRVIVAASVHQQRHPESVEIFVVARRGELAERPTLFLSVSLSAAFPEGVADARAYVETFLADTAWKPTQSYLIAGAVRYSEYDYFKAQIIEHIVLKGRKGAGPKGDHEFTDWTSLRSIFDTFIS